MPDTDPRPSRLWRTDTLLVLLAALAISIFRVVAGMNCYPAFDGDGITYVPPIVYEARGEGLTTPFWEAMSRIDPTGQNRLVFHGWFYQKFMADVFHPDTFKKVHFWKSLIEVGIMLAMAFTFMRLPRLENTGARRLRALAAVLALAAVSTSMGASRVEFVGSLVVAVWLLVQVWTRLRNFLVPTVIATILLLVTIPVTGIFMGLMLALWIAMNHGAVKTLKLWGICAGAIGLATVLLCQFYYPFGLSEWINGCLVHARISVVNYNDGRTVGEYVKYWITNSSFSFHLFYYALGLLGLFAVVRRLKPSQAASPLAWLAGGLLAGAVFYFILRNPPHCYNAVSFSPLMALGCVWLAGRFFSDGGKLKGWATGLGVAGVLGLAGIGFFRQALVFPTFLSAGMSYDDARAKVLEISARNPGRVVAGLPLLFLQEDAARVRFIPKDISQAKADVLLLQQVNTGRSTPPETYPDDADFKLEWHNFTLVRPTLLGVPLGSSPQAYNFAVYRKVPSPASAAEGK